MPSPAAPSLPHPTEKPGNDRIPLYSCTHGALIPGSVLWDEEGGGKWDGNRMGGRPGWNSVHKVKPCSDGNQNSWFFFFSPSPSIKLPVLLQEASINSRGIFQMEFSKIIIPPWKRRPRDPPRRESPEPGNVWEPVKISSLSRNPQCSAYGKSAPGAIPDLRSGGKR